MSFTFVAAVLMLTYQVVRMGGLYIYWQGGGRRLGPRQSFTIHGGITSLGTSTWRLLPVSDWLHVV